MRTILALAAFLILSLFPGNALAEKTHIFHLDHEENLSSNFVRSICQDSHGFVWVATNEGLNRFDGKNFRLFTKENSGLSSNELNSIIQDPMNPDKIWISTRYAGICSYDYTTDKITPFPGKLNSKDVPFLAPTSDNRIWVIQYFFVPNKLNTTNSQLESLLPSTPGDFKKRIWSAAEDASGEYLYLGHDGEGLTRINLRSKKYENFSHTESPGQSPGGDYVYAIHPDSDGNIWLGTENGVSIFDPSSGKFQNISHTTPESALPPGAVKAICEMKNGELWFGTDKGGISILTPANRHKKEYRFAPLSQIYPGAKTSSPSISAIFEDTYGNKWVGNFSDGIDVMSYRQPFFSLTKPFSDFSSQSPKQSVWSVTTDNKGRVWLGGENMLMMAGENSRIIPIPESLTGGGHSYVRALLCDKTGEIWIGTNNAGIFTYSPSENRFTHIDMPEKEILCFAYGRNGELLAGTHGGIYRIFNDGSVKEASEINRHLNDLYVTALRLDSNGHLWVGTFGKGLTVISPTGAATSFDVESGLPSNTVNDLTEDSKGNIWAATREGAVRIAKDNISNIKTYNDGYGLMSHDIKAITEGPDGNIWMSTNRGVAMLNTKSDSLSVYGKTYGARMTSFTEGSVATDTDRNVLFGSLNGLLHFNPAQSNERADKHAISLTSLNANDRNANDQNMLLAIPVSSGEIKLPYNLNTFTLRFCNPDITTEANCEYVYNMKGVNEVWSLVNDDNMAVYRSLRPGKYEFRVRHRINGEQWSEPETLATIVITPPLYLTWWAKLLYLISAILIIGVFLYFYKHKVDLEKNLAIEKENSKNDRQMNEERMVFFTNITHELRTPLSLIVGPIEDLVNDTSLKPEQRKKLLTIRSSSMRLLNLINGILEFRKTETHNKRLEVTYGNFANFVREIGIRFKELNNNPELNIVIDVAEMEDTEMYFDPEVITITLNNLLSNAMKYTKAGTITLSLHPFVAGGMRYADLSVGDTGEGISPDALPHIFERYYQAKHNRKVSGTGIGLALSKNLVELHEGTITVKSEPGKGSIFTVRLITDNSYPNALHKESMDSADGQNATDAAQAADNEKLSLLIVEDDDDVREYIAQSFGDDFNVYTAADGKEGLDKALEKIPDIIVSDIMMPVMDGIEFCSKIKSDSAISHIPVILLTAKDSLLDKEQGYAAGADSYITKPFSANLLKARINNILESRHKLTMRMLDDDTETSESKAKDNILNTSDLPPQEPNLEVELTPFDREFIAKFKKLTEENIEMEELDIAFFTDKMCMSHSTLYRKVKSITGFTPNEFIRKIKLHKAAEMLAGGKVAMSEIPFKTGFNSSAYFRRVFKKEFGVSPTEYVENLRCKM